MEAQTTLLYESTHKLPAVFSQPDIQIILDTIENSSDYLKNDWGSWMKARDKCVIMLMYLFALRPREALSLRFSDFDLKSGTLFINGINNKEKKDRILPLPPNLIHHLSQYCKFNRERFWLGSSYLFPSFEDKHKPLSNGTWKGRFRRILKQAGLWQAPIKPSNCPAFRSYTLRHTRASEILEKTHDVFLVANLLGHAKLESTKVYLHKNKGYMQYMRNALS